MTHKSVWPQLQKIRQQQNECHEKPIAQDEDINNAFNTLLRYVIRDFIQSWYIKITNSPTEQSFPFAVDGNIRSAATKLAQRLETTDLLSVILNRIIPRMTSHISEFRAAEVSLLGKSLERSVTQSDELDLLLASRFRSGKLHRALTTVAMTTKPTEIAYLRQMIERVLPYMIDHKELQSGPVRVVIREVVSNSVLQPVLDMLADPDFWNQNIDAYLGKAIIEQKMVRQLREVIRQHSTHNDLDADDVMNLIKKKQYGIGSIKMGKRTFQDFLKMIQEEKNLLDLKRVRNDIVTQIRKKKARIVDRDPEEVVDGEKVQDIIVYVNRLGVAKKRVDKRIATLSGEQFDFVRYTSHVSGVGYSLSEILTNTSGLSYFMEFMDRRGDMVKLQFWLIVEGFNSTAISNNEERKTFLQDVKMVYEMYFTDTAPHRLHVAEQFNEDLKNAIDLSFEKEKGDEESFANQIRELNLRLYRIQQHVFWEIEKEHYPYFKRSDLYFKFLSSTPPVHTNPIPEEVPARRSLDESTLYTSNTSRSIKGNRPASIHESSSSASIPVILTPTISTPLKESTSYFNTPKQALSDFNGRSRGHQRALSDSTKSSRFLSFSNIFQSNRLWSYDEPSSHAPKSIKSTEETEEEEEEDEDEEFANGSERARLVKTTNVHFAPPGDLMLASKVEQLSAEVEKLTAQEAIVDALITKAEAQNKLEELRILKKSKTMFRQDLQQIQYQKSQYELQESENVLMPDRSQVNITSATIGSDKNGEFALYVIEIQQLGADGNYASGWIVARRYSEFFALHQKLKERYPAVRHIEFPAKWPLLKLQKPFVEARRISLERYLRKLVDDKDICNSQEFRSFLSQQNIFSIAALDDTQQKKIPNKGFMQHIYKTVAAGLDDMLVGPSMLDLITQRLGEQVMEFDQNNTSPPASSSSSRSKTTDSTDINAAHVAESSTELPDSLKAEGITRFTEPLCDLFIEMFELKDKTNWLRRQAVVIILQQILEGTIERKLRELLKYLCSSSMVVFYFNKITSSLWPNGGPLAFKEARKPEEKIQTREEANRKLSTWLPDLLGNMVGRQNARKGARRLFTVLQNKRLNQDLIYTLLDEVIYALFPEITDINASTPTAT
ncbi:hypothetical protein MUCCIDRAFT_143777 [Mucor lusitanicus CBS 277.49]|uniref:PX domain-containing protein n=1 Tax=Mucor lusitanicus CBS 277.49 TaxID=747725 RepID=A0A168LHL3_MUCCL|nr:hypothetical protein MUCCIDRAFT_143777 [Mucor lusitanicus CBS 277.49]